MAQNIFEVTEITFGLTEDQNITSNLKFIKTRGYQLNKKFIGDDEWVEKTSGPVKELKIIESPKLFDSIISKGGLINIDPSVEDFDQPLFKKPIDKLEKLAETYIPDGAESGNEKTAIKMIFSKKGSSDVFTLIAVRNVGYAIYDNQGTEVASGNTTEPGLEIETDPSKSPPVGGGGTTTPTDPTNPTIQKIVDTIGQPLGINQQNLDSIANWITNHPAISASLLAAGVGGAVQILGPLLFGAGGLLSGALGSKLGQVLPYAAIAAVLFQFGPQIMQALQGVGSSISGGLGSLFGGGIVPGAMGALFGSETMGTFIAYDGGKEVDNKSTAPYQRCLIRLGKGNLAMERANLQPPAYNPVIGIKIPGKKNYADDGRFGQWTLDASRNMFQTINTLNKDKIKDNPKFEIKDPARVPVEILISPACVGNTQMNPTAAEQQAFEATKKVPAKKPEPKNLPESKVYKEYGFLSTKNEKLHSVLMEQLKKDLKRG